MALFDFFKKLKKRNIVENETKISFSEIRNYLEKTESENLIKEKQVFDLIQEEVNDFIKIIREKINIVESIDLDSKKAEEKFKSITDTCRKKYIESVENFTQSLNALQKKELKKFTEGINRIFLVFHKSSHGNYERATVLIGEEMKDIREQIKNFSAILTEMIDKNKRIIECYEIISVVRQKLDELGKNDDSHRKIEGEIFLLDKKIKSNKKRVEEILEETEKMKKSDDYLKNSDAKEKVKLLKTELDKDISDLKQLVDFKKLMNFFHIFEGQMKVVKDYETDFKTKFKQDYGDSILILLNEAKLNNESIENKIKEIKNKKQEIENCMRDVTEDAVEVLSAEIKKMKSDIDEMHNERDRKNKISEKLKISKEHAETEIKDELKKMHVIVEVDD